jgi:hypothetical protein
LPKSEPLFPPNQFYDDAGACLKVAMCVLEHGLKRKGTKLTYSEENGVSWLSQLSRELEGQVSRAKIDQCLDSLLDKGTLAHGKQIMQKVTDEGVDKWVRAYHIGNEFVPQMLQLYKFTHDIKALNDVDKR